MTNQRRESAMTQGVQHFAINADDLQRARAFYETVFGWSFQCWGPPDFFQIESGGPIRGSLQKRRELAPGLVLRGFECTISVDDVDRVASEVEAAGGRLLMEKSTIVGVGHLIFFEDTEGNCAGAMQYDSDAQ
ncbi:MAG: VOC family protein [Myxococcota bacterium]